MPKTALKTFKYSVKYMYDILDSEGEFIDVGEGYVNFESIYDKNKPEEKEKILDIAEGLAKAEPLGNNISIVGLGAISVL